MSVSGVSGRAPLRVVLTVVTVALLAVGLLVAGLTSTAILRGFLVDQVDAQLHDVIGAVSDHAQSPDPGRPGGPSGGPGGPSNLAVVYLSSSGSVIASSSPSVSPPAVPAWTAAEVAAQDERPVTLPSTDGATTWRALAAPTSAGSVVVAQNLATVDSIVRRLALIEGATALLILLALAFLAWWLVKRSLRPLNHVEETAAAIAAGDLDRRVPEGPTNTEVGRLAATFNLMLGRIQSAFAAQQQSEAAARHSEESMRRFLADASHELRTPLTSIRGYSELYRQGAMHDSDGVDRAMSRIESESVRMGGLVDDMLALARLEQPRSRELAPLDLSTVAREVVDDARVATPGRHLTLDAPHPVTTMGDDDAVRQVIANLVANAFVHTAGDVSVSVASAGDQAFVVVADEGPGLTEGQQALVFERFYRADPARSRAHGGSGLGLSIARAIIVDQGGELTVTSSPDGGSTFTIALPVTAPSQPEESR